MYDESLGICRGLSKSELNKEVLLFYCRGFRQAWRLRAPNTPHTSSRGSSSRRRFDILIKILANVPSSDWLGSIEGPHSGRLAPIAFLKTAQPYAEFHRPRLLDGFILKAFVYMTWASRLVSQLLLLVKTSCVLRPSTLLVQDSIDATCIHAIPLHSSQQFIPYCIRFNFSPQWLPTAR